MGNKKKSEDNWLETADAFNSLLSSLTEISGTQAEKEQNESIENNKEEKRSHGIIGRIYHRKKFVNAKNAALMDGKPLNEILGITPLKPEEKSDISPCKADLKSNIKILKKLGKYSKKLLLIIHY